MPDEWEDLERDADERLEQLEEEIPDEWGEWVSLAEGERFRGFWRGCSVDTSGQYGDRPVYLLLDQDLRPVFIRGGLKILDAEMDKAAPGEGDLVFIRRGTDGPGKEGGVSYRFVVRTKPAPQAELPYEQARGNCRRTTDYTARRARLPTTAGRQAADQDRDLRGRDHAL